MYSFTRIFSYKIRELKENPQAEFRAMREQAEKTFYAAGYHPLSMFIYSTQYRGKPDYGVWAKALLDATPENKELLSQSVHQFVGETNAVCVVNVSEMWMGALGEEGFKRTLAWQQANPGKSLAEFSERRDVLAMICEFNGKTLYEEAEIKERKLGPWTNPFEGGELTSGGNSRFGNFLRKLDKSQN